MSLQFVGKIAIPEQHIYVSDSMSGNCTSASPLGLSTASHYRTLLFSATDNSTSAATLSESRKNFDALMYKVGAQSATDGICYQVLANTTANFVNFEFGYGGGTNEYYAHVHGQWSDDTHVTMTKSKAILAPLTTVSCTGTSAHDSILKNCIYEIWGINRQ